MERLSLIIAVGAVGGLGVILATIGMSIERVASEIKELSLSIDRFRESYDKHNKQAKRERDVREAFAHRSQD